MLYISHTEIWGMLIFSVYFSRNLVGKHLIISHRIHNTSVLELCLQAFCMTSFFFCFFQTIGIRVKPLYCSFSW